MLNVVFIDDEHWTLRGLEKMINWNAEGFQIIEMFENARSAEIFCMSHPEIDLMIVDIRLGSSLGTDLIVKLKPYLPNTTFVLISGYSDFAYAKQGIKIGVSDYFEKPINEAELLDFLRELKSQKENNTLETQSNTPFVYSEDSLSSQTIQDMMKYINMYYKETINLDVLAKEFNISKKYISSFFKRETGISITEYIRTVRLDKAKQLLKSTNYSLQQITALCGYHDYFYFAKSFKKEMGLTLTEYRKKHTMK